MPWFAGFPVSTLYLLSSLCLPIPFRCGTIALRSGDRLLLLIALHKADGRNGWMDGWTNR